MQFWRIVNNKLYLVNEVQELGFEKKSALYIPDEYLQKQDFTVLRTCMGIGDWGVISAMPRLLKQKYPNCKVKIPSEKLQKQLFKNFSTEWIKSWSNPFETYKYIFENNPYVDEVVDSIDGDIFHDHYRVYDDENINEPLLDQIMRFWQFTPEEFEDSSPELYFSEEEEEIALNIISEFTNGFCGTVLISNRYKEERDGELIRKVLNKYNDIKYFYWVSDKNINLPIEKALDLRHVPVRIQLCIKSNAQIIVCNQCGMDIMFPRYTDVYMAPKDSWGLGSNTVKGKLHIKIEDI